MFSGSVAIWIARDSVYWQSLRSFRLSRHIPSGSLVSTLVSTFPHPSPLATFSLYFTLLHCRFFSSASNSRNWSSTTFGYIQVPSGIGNCASTYALNMYTLWGWADTILTYSRPRGLIAGAPPGIRLFVTSGRWPDLLHVASAKVHHLWFLRVGLFLRTQMCTFVATF